MADWIVQTRGKYAGRIGVVDLDSSFSRSGRQLCRFGSCGPSIWLMPSSTRKATHREIADRLGCNPSDLPKYLKDSHPV